jgi:hypothetical protein
MSEQRSRPAEREALAARVCDGHYTWIAAPKPISFDTLDVQRNRSDEADDSLVHIGRELAIERVREKDSHHVCVWGAHRPRTDDVARPYCQRLPPWRPATHRLPIHRGRSGRTDFAVP